MVAERRRHDVAAMAIDRGEDGMVDGELDVITTSPRDVVGATFQELLTSARTQYASGEGLR